MAQKLGNARLAIPKVNKNPQVRGAQPTSPVKRAIGNATAVKTAATTPAQATNAVPATQTTPTDPFQTASAPAAPKPTGLFEPPAYSPAAGQPDPRDKKYWDNISKLKFSSEQEYSKGLLEQQRADTDYGDAVQTAIRNRTVEQRTLGENAIRGNLGASGWLNRNEAEQTTAYTQDRAHASRNKEEDDQGRLAAREAIRQMFGIDAGIALTDAGERYAEGAEAAAQNEAPTVGAPASSGPGASAGKGKAKVGIGSNKVAVAPGPHVGNAQALNAAKQAIAKRKKAK